MGYNIEYSGSAKKDLKNLSKNIALDILDSVDNNLSNNPGIDKELSGKKYKGFFSFRVNDYRVIYTINNKTQTISIIVLGHRKDVYKILNRKI